jgi:hypothetical protein
VKFLEMSFDAQEVWDLFDKEQLSAVFVFMLPKVTQKIGRLLAEWIKKQQDESFVLRVVTQGFPMDSLGSPVEIVAPESCPHLKLYLYHASKTSLALNVGEDIANNKS